MGRNVDIILQLRWEASTLRSKFTPTSQRSELRFGDIVSDSNLNRTNICLSGQEWWYPSCLIPGSEGNWYKTQLPLPSNIADHNMNMHTLLELLLWRRRISHYCTNFKSIKSYLERRNERNHSFSTLFRWGIQLNAIWSIIDIQTNILYSLN